MEKTTISLNVNAVFLRLPPKELKQLVFNRLGKTSLLAARCVSKLWKNLIDSNLEFHLELADSTRPFVESFGESRQVTSLSTTSFQGPYPPEGLQIATKMLRIAVQNLEDNENYQEYLRKSKQDPLKNIGLSYDNLRGIMHDFYNVEKLQIASLAVKSFNKPQPQLLGQFHLPNVKEMIITFFDGGFHQLLPLMKANFPKLEVVNICNSAETRKDRPQLYSWIFGFVGRHRKTLSEVILILPEGKWGGGGGDDPNLFHNQVVLDQLNIRNTLRKDLKIPQNMYVVVKHRLETLTKLKKLNWDVGMLEGQRRYDLGTTLLVSQTMLVQLNLDNLRLKDLPLWGQMDKLLENICGTLETLLLGGCLCVSSSALGVYTFNCSWLKNCKRLKQLEVVICGISIDSIEDLSFEQLRFLNLGHMLMQDQIEFICRHGVNLEMWMVPQRGYLKNMLVAKITSYLFQCMLYLPKLNTVTLFSACVDEHDILKFILEQPGIQRCGGRISVAEHERNGDIKLHIDRQVLARDHGQLNRFMDENRVDPVEQVNLRGLMDYVMRNIIPGIANENHDDLIVFRRDDEYVEDA